MILGRRRTLVAHPWRELMSEQYNVSVTISAIEMEAARIEQEHAMQQKNCMCAVCQDQRYRRKAADDARLQLIEKAAREVLEQVKGDPKYLYVITDPRKASAALIALRQALGDGRE
jgi:hypothetical protein